MYRLLFGISVFSGLRAYAEGLLCDLDCRLAKGLSMLILEPEHVPMFPVVLSLCQSYIVRT